MDDEVQPVTAELTDGSLIEAERQLTASVERHRAAVASMQELGRAEAGQHVAIKVVGRAVQLVSFVLRRAAAAGVPFERLVELTDWEPDLVREALQQAVPEPRVVARLAPAGLDAHAIAEAAATFEAIRCLRELTDRVLVDVDDDARLPLAAVDVVDLYNRFDAAWRSWGQELGRQAT